jgi:hypothetical protein
MLEWVGVALLIAYASLMHRAGDSSSCFNAVDIFNAVSGAWSTAALSFGRYGLAATSLPNHGVAIFAGGEGTCCHAYFSIFWLCWLGNRMVDWAGFGLLIACASLMPCAAVGGYSNTADIFNVTSGAWSTASLSVARQYLAATSLPDLGVAIFAGGQGTSCHVYFSVFECCVVLVGESNA